MGLGGLFGIFSCCCLACSSSEPVAFDPAAVDAGHDGDVDAPAIDANDAGLSKRSHFIMIHLEAYHKGPTDPDFSSTILDVPSPFRDEPLGYQRYVWPAVQQLVADADEFGFKLTLAMNPQWSDFILADSTREALVQSWRQVGHELAHHHHPANHPDWNGYTNDASLSHDPLFLGTVSAGYDLVARLVPTGTLRTAMIGGLPEDMPIDSWKRVNGQIVLTSGNQFDSYPDGPEPLAPLRPFEDPKPPELGDPEGTIVVLNHRELGTTNHRTIEEAIEAYQHQYLGLQPDEVFGLVFHGFDYLKARDRILPWFEFVAEEGGSVKTIHEIVATYPYEFDPG
jgi:hypothetical protein